MVNRIVTEVAGHCANDQQHMLTLPLHYTRCRISTGNILTKLANQKTAFYSPFFPAKSPIVTGSTYLRSSYRQNIRKLSKHNYVTN